LHPSVFAEFDRICARGNAGGDVLEIGSVPSPDTLLCLPSLSGAKSKIGLNLDGPHRYDGFEIVRGNANWMDCFADQSFDTVLCNSVLEHDRKFWQTAGEIRRVARAGALIAIGVPGFVTDPLERKASRLAKALGKLGLPRTIRDALDASTLTLRKHCFPNDYYRFSERAVGDVLLEGLTDVEVSVILHPPRIIGMGFKPGSPRK